jgi:hypothetical protein
MVPAGRRKLAHPLRRSMNSLAVVIVSVVAVSIGGTVVFAQSRDMSKDRNDPSRARRAPARQVPLKIGKCVAPNCMAVRLDDLGTTNGVLFGSIPLAGVDLQLQGALCTCDRPPRCHEDPDARWHDANPPRSGWGVVNLNEARVLKGRLRDMTAGKWWVIRWRWVGGALPSYSWNVFISKSRPAQELQELKVVCTSGDSQP